MYKILIDNGAKRDITNNIGYNSLVYYGFHFEQVSKENSCLSIKNARIVNFKKSYQTENHFQQDLKRRRIESYQSSQNQLC